MRILVFLLFSIFYSNAQACSCAQTDVTDGYSSSDVVFLGKITGVKEIVDPNETLGGRSRKPLKVQEATFSVLESYKGLNSKTFKTRTVIQGGLCGLSLKQVKTKYLVYTDRNSDGSYSLSFCSRTKNARQAKADLLYLRKVDR